MSSFYIPKIRGPIAFSAPVAFGIIDNSNQISGIVGVTSVTSSSGTTTYTFSVLDADSLGTGVLAPIYTISSSGITFSLQTNYLIVSNNKLDVGSVGQVFTITSSVSVPNDLAYAGVVYTISPSFSIQSSSTTIVVDKLMLIPMAGQYYNIWRSGVISTASDSAAITFWTNDTQTEYPDVFSPSGSCNTGGWLSNQDSGCFFTTLDEAYLGYFYNYCSTACGGTGSCFGSCTSPATCQFDYDPSLENNSNPYSCNPKYPSPPKFYQKYFTYIVIIAVMVLILVGIFILFGFIIYRSHHRVTSVQHIYPNRGII